MELKQKLSYLWSLMDPNYFQKIGLKRNLKYKKQQNILFEYERKTADDSDLSLV